MGSPPDLDPESLVLSAEMHLESGELDLALEAAGFVVAAEPERPEGYSLLGDVHLERCELDEAAFAYEKAVAKSERAGKASASALFNLSRLAETEILRGDLDRAILALERFLAHDPIDDDGVRNVLAELMLRRGRYPEVLRLQSKRDDLPPDACLVLAFAYLETGDVAEAVVSTRSVFLSNLFILAALLTEDPPEFDFTQHGETTTQAFAMELIERLADYLRSHSSRVDAIAAIAQSDLVQYEVAALITCAKALNKERAAPLRQRLLTRIRCLRDPARLRATSAEVLEDLELE